MRERSLVAFTLLGQAAVGMFWALALVGWVVPGGAAWARGPRLAVGALMLLAGLAAVLHLGSPRNAWRAVANVGSSWLSREVALSGLFGVAWAGVVLLERGLATAPAGLDGTYVAHVAVNAVTVSVAVATALAAAVGGALIYAMARVYRLRTVPAWDTELTTASFFLTAVALGAPAAALALRAGVGAHAPVDATTAVAVARAAAGGALPAPPVAMAVLRALMAAAMVALAGELVVELGSRVGRETEAALVDPGLNPHAANDAGSWRVVLVGAAQALCALAWLAGTAGAPAHLFTTATGLALAGVAVAAVVGRGRFYGSYARRGL